MNKNKLKYTYIDKYKKNNQLNQNVLFLKILHSFYFSFQLLTLTYFELTLMTTLTHTKLHY